MRRRAILYFVLSRLMIALIKRWPWFYWGSSLYRSRRAYTIEMESSRLNTNTKKYVCIHDFIQEHAHPCILLCRRVLFFRPKLRRNLILWRNGLNLIQQNRTGFDLLQLNNYLLVWSSTGCLRGWTSRHRASAKDPSAGPCGMEWPGHGSTPGEQLGWHSWWWSWLLHWTHTKLVMMISGKITLNGLFS